MKARARAVVEDEDAVREHRVDVGVEVEASPEALRERDAPRAAPRDAGAHRTVSLEALHFGPEDAEQRTEGRGAPRERETDAAPTPGMEESVRRDPQVPREVRRARQARLGEGRAGSATGEIATPGARHPG